MTRPQLSSVAVVSPNDVWAVGISYDYSVYRTMVMHWNGTNWRFFASPSPGSSANFLYSVDAVSATDIWAVGDMVALNVPVKTLVLHFNGSKWSVVPSPNVPGPNPGSSENRLTGVAAVSANDVWAVGSGSNGALTMHWDGTAWTDVWPDTPTGTLNSLAMQSHDDGWAGTSPHVEVNYGAFPDVQLHVIAPVAWARPPGGPARFGYGDTELGAKVTRHTRTTFSHSSVATRRVFITPVRKTSCSRPS